MNTGKLPSAPLPPAVVAPGLLLAGLIALCSCAPRASSGRSVEQLLRDLTLEQKVGQRFMTSLPGTALSDRVRELVAEGWLGGVILTPGNIVSREQLSSFVAALQRAARERPGGPEIGLLVAIDHEGGRVDRFRDLPGFTRLPSAAVVASHGPAYAEAAAFLMAADLAGVGVNMNLAPVLDLAVGPDGAAVGDRSYGPDPKQVGSLGAGFVRAAKRAGVIAVPKHFPGHGATALDSHDGLPVVPGGRGPQFDRNLAPFRAALSAGAEALMTAHLLFPDIDPRDPASFSAPIIRGILRAELGFRGVVISDAIEMKAVRERYTLGEVIARSFAADVDIVLARDLYDVFALRDETLRLLAAGAVSVEDVDRGAARVLALKRRHGLLP